MIVNYLQYGRGKLRQIKSVIASRGKDSRLRTRRAPAATVRKHGERALSRQEATSCQGSESGVRSSFLTKQQLKSNFELK